MSVEAVDSGAIAQRQSHAARLVTDEMRKRLPTKPIRRPTLSPRQLANEMARIAIATTDRRQEVARRSFPDERPGETTPSAGGSAYA